MSSLESALSQYHRGELPLNQLSAIAESIAAAGGPDTEAARAAVEAAHRAGTLDDAGYFTLLDAFNDETRIVYRDVPADDSDATRIDAREVSVAGDDATRIAPADDDATRVTPPDDDATVVAIEIGDDDATVAQPSLSDDETIVRSDDDDATIVATAGEDDSTLLGHPPGLIDAASFGGDFRTGTLDQMAASIAGQSAPPSLNLSQTPWTQMTDGGGPLTRVEVGAVVKDRFELQKVLGVGGMGMVFKALDRRKVEASDKEAFVALKVLNEDFRDNPLCLIALQRETKRAQTLSHPNIINVYDFDRDGSHVFMSMEYLNGRPLNQVIHELGGGGMSFEQAWPLIEAMGSALAYAHRKGIVHSDFKPGNVFVDESGEVKVLDFGIACAMVRADANPEERTVFNARTMLGALTPTYASLEQLQSKEPDPRDDLYALAVVTYELLTGHHPFAKLSAEKALELQLTAKPISGLSRRQWKALRKGLAFNQKDRLASVDDFLAGLRPRSALYYGMWVAGITALLITATNVWLNLNAVPVEPAVTKIELTPEQAKQVQDLIEVGGIHFEVGYYTAPTGNNALWAYREALKIDPYNDAALAGIHKIADTLEQSAWEAFEKGDRATSLKRVVEGLEAEPNHDGLTKLRAKLER